MLTFAPAGGGSQRGGLLLCFEWLRCITVFLQMYQDVVWSFGTCWALCHLFLFDSVTDIWVFSLEDP